MFCSATAYKSDKLLTAGPTSFSFALFMPPLPHPLLVRGAIPQLGPESDVQSAEGDKAEHTGEHEEGGRWRLTLSSE